METIGFKAEKPQSVETPRPEKAETQEVKPVNVETVDTTEPAKRGRKPKFN